MAEPRYLDRYRDEIIRLHRQRYTQARIRRHLEETYTIDVPKTTLSNFMAQLRSEGAIGTAAEPRVTPEEEQFLAQYEVFQKLEQSSAQVLEGIAQIMARLTTLEESAQQREEAMLAALRGNPQARPGARESFTASDQVAGASNPISWPRLFLLIVLILAVLAGIYYAFSR
jgi:hypothetical protein